MKLTRRDFLKNTSILSSAFVIGFYIPQKSRAETKTEKILEPNAFVRINSNNKIDFIISQVEMGQGTYTTLAMCIAEELDVNWEKINIIPAEVKPVYNSIYGPFMITGGSSSLRTKQTQMREIGSALNIMFKIAASKRWKIREFNIKIKDAKVFNTINKESFTFGDLVADLEKIKIPTNPKIKDLKDCKIIGQPTKRHAKEAWAKIKGEAKYSIDIRIKDLKYAAVLHPLVFGAKVKSYDDSKAIKKEGILKIKEIPTGIAVIAEHWWQAKEALKEITVIWDEGEFVRISEKELDAEYSSMMKQSGAIMKESGNTQKAFDNAVTIIEKEFNFPFLAHAAMEPISCTIHHTKDSAEVWCNAQAQTLARDAIAKALEIEKENIKYHTPYLGGGFGRRAPNNFDFSLESGYIAKDEKWPIMMIWSREDDIKMGNYRPKYKNMGRMALNKEGEITAFEAKVVGQSLFKNTILSFLFKDGVDYAQKEGLAQTPYKIENEFMQAYTPESPIPVLWWRSVGHTQTGPFVEVMIDEASIAAKIDPIEYRIKLLKKERHINLLKDVAKLANWVNRKKEENIGYGVAIVESFKSICAQIVKVRVINNDYKVENVWCSIDCGFAFNPLNVENQMISSINFALAATKYSQLSIKNGAVEQSNFHDYIVSRISDAPDIKVSILNSMEEIGGIGEPGVPPLFGAVINALYDATGKRYTSFPIKLG